MKKIVFMGTPLFAVPILKSILSKGYNIPLVYTQPPAKSNRGYKVNKSPIHIFCDENDLKVRTPENFMNLDDEKNILEKSIHLDNLWTSIWLITDLQNIIIVTITIYFTYQMDSVVGLLIFTNISSITGTINRINRFWRQKEVLSVKRNNLSFAFISK